MLGLIETQQNKTNKKKIPQPPVTKKKEPLKLLINTRNSQPSIQCLWNISVGFSGPNIWVKFHKGAFLAA